MIQMDKQGKQTHNAAKKYSLKHPSRPVYVFRTHDDLTKDSWLCYTIAEEELQNQNVSPEDIICKYINGVQQ